MIIPDDPYEYRRHRRPTKLLVHRLSSDSDTQIVVVRKSRREQIIEARRDFVQKLSNTYGHQKTESEINFIKIVHDQGIVSLGLVISYCFMLWYGCCHYVHSFTFGVDYIRIFSCDDVHGNGSSNASFQVKCFTPQTNCCGFGRYSYIEIGDFYNTFYGAFMTAIKEKVLVTDKDKCRNYLKKMNNDSYISLLSTRALTAKLEFECDESWPIWIKLSGMFGRIIAGVLIGLVGDIHGRKPAFIIAASTQITGFIIEIVNSKWYVLVGEFMAGFGPIALGSLYILVLEKCSNDIVPWMGLLVFLIHPFSNLVAFILRYTIKSWKLIHLADTTLMLVCPFGMWYMVESPRWLMMVGDRPGAWEALQQYGHVEPDRRDMQQPIDRRPSVKTVLKYFSPAVYRDRIIILMLFYILCAISLYVNRTTAVEGFETGMAKFFAILTAFQVIIYMLTYFVAIKLGRRRALFYLHCLVSFLDLIVFMAHRHFDKKTVFPLMLYGHMAAAHAVLFVVIYYTVELFPTPFRATALGISFSTLGAGEAMQHYLNYVFDAPPDSIDHMPAFLGSLTCALAITFLPVTHNRGLPDRPAEGIYFKIYF